uniref:Uncharacterized protein n=1 Tax=Rhizophora mucronata TaxID=61149 RepID=A0A2P2Q3T9_RHIMU
MFNSSVQDNFDRGNLFSFNFYNQFYWN